ncbi:hypothetical protein UAY_00432 [Enterococcus moraviensis ATCC BAA-383]|uniref:Uncharacterized protein n=1 Tax=Enterococcus moraviensis ATCC BAA-383 TaxID=1158609 RepID=R2RFG4_9ENTE|nr:hypothetical protein UAY_00432 [Enterococcus moraviensis ATCC BAA-383]EOT63741.1 hypothetical protein I586_03174 [Enterococcus moraviensis ATCC BAA-383]
MVDMPKITAGFSYIITYLAFCHAIISIFLSQGTSVSKKR